MPEIVQRAHLTWTGKVTQHGLAQLVAVFHQMDLVGYHLPGTMQSFAMNQSDLLLPRGIDHERAWIDKREVVYRLHDRMFLGMAPPYIKHPMWIAYAACGFPRTFRVGTQLPIDI